MCLEFVKNFIRLGLERIFMVKQIIIKLPDWVDEKNIERVVRDYVELKLPDTASREEYTEFLEVDLDEIVEYPADKELKILRDTRKKAKNRCQF